LWATTYGLGAWGELTMIDNDPPTLTRIGLPDREIQQTDHRRVRRVAAWLLINTSG
jgi:hypothetical protein